MKKYNKYSFYSEKVTNTFFYKITANTLIIKYKEKKEKFEIIEKGQDYNYTFKFVKNQINIPNLKGFEQFIEEANNPNNSFNDITFNFFIKKRRYWNDGRVKELLGLENNY